MRAMRVQVRDKAHPGNASRPGKSSFGMMVGVAGSQLQSSSVFCRGCSVFLSVGDAISARALFRLLCRMKRRGRTEDECKGILIEHGGGTRFGFLTNSMSPAAN